MLIKNTALIGSHEHHNFFFFSTRCRVKHTFSESYRCLTVLNDWKCLECVIHARWTILIQVDFIILFLIPLKSNKETAQKLSFHLLAFVAEKSSEVEKRVISCGFLALITRSFTILPANELIETRRFGLPARRKFSILSFQRV